LEPGAAIGELRGVTVLGRTEIVEGGARLRDIAANILDRKREVPWVTTIRSTISSYNGVGIIIDPERTASWDPRKLA
jgi:hypothetical protein